MEHSRRQQVGGVWGLVLVLGLGLGLGLDLGSSLGLGVGSGLEAWVRQGWIIKPTSPTPPRASKHDACT